MSEGAGAIEDLRREIDAIDTALHDLLIRRSQIAAEIGALKSGAAGARPNGRDTALLRPGREAVILRRLVERHHGPLPWGTIVRIWRELMSAVLRAQGPFAVAVYEPDDAAGGYWDLARDHFGAHTPMTAHGSPETVVRAVVEDRATVGVLPLPRAEEARPWWTDLTGEPTAPQVCARLPFGAPGVTRGAAVEAFVVARVPAEATGEDRTLTVVETSAETTPAALRRILAAAGFEVSAAWSARPSAAGRAHLAELTGFVAAEDGRWRGVRAAPGVRRLWPAGGYAVPLHPDAAAPGAATIPPRHEAGRPLSSRHR